MLTLELPYTILEVLTHNINSSLQLVLNFNIIYLYYLNKYIFHLVDELLYTAVKLINFV